METLMRISEVATSTGLSQSTIRYYERMQLCPAIARAPDGRRCYSLTDVDWLTLLASLRDTGMPMTEMSTFAALYRQGDETVQARKAMLIAHQQRLARRKKALEKCADLLVTKIEKYDAILEKRT